MCGVFFGLCALLVFGCFVCFWCVCDYGVCFFCLKFVCGICVCFQSMSVNVCGVCFRASVLCACLSLFCFFSVFVVCVNVCVYIWFMCEGGEFVRGQCVFVFLCVLVCFDWFRVVWICVCGMCVCVCVGVILSLCGVFKLCVFYYMCVLCICVLVCFCVDVLCVWCLCVLCGVLVCVLLCGVCFCFL